jgi:hypothetical protein
MTKSSSLKLTFAAAALLSLCASGAYARQGVSYHQVPQFNYSGYVGPHGHFSSLSDFTRSINGTPCGEECTARHERLWAPQER